MLLDIDSAQTLPWTGRVLVFASYAPEPLWIGGADNVYGMMTTSTIWTEAKAVHKANQVYFLPSADEVERQAIVDDLVGSLNPPKNRG